MSLTKKAFLIVYTSDYPPALFFQYPDYLDAHLRLAAIAKARNNVQLSTELVTL